MSELFSDPKTWVSIAFFVMLAGVFFFKVPQLIAKLLDARSAQIAKELQEAQALRAEAEQVLALYKKKQSEYMKEAESILKQARLDADNLAAHADKELKLALDARMEHALQKIAQEEARAIQDVRSHVVDISLAAARALVIEHVKKIPQAELLKLAISDIERKVH